MRDYIIRKLRKIIKKADRQRKDADNLACLILYDKEYDRVEQHHNFCCRGHHAVILMGLLIELIDEMEDEEFAAKLKDTFNGTFERTLH